MITRCGIGTLRRLAHLGDSAHSTENNSHNLFKITLAYNSSIPHPPFKKRQENLLTVKVKSKKFRTVWMEQWWRGLKKKWIRAKFAIKDGNDDDDSGGGGFKYKISLFYSMIYNVGKKRLHVSVA